MIRPRDVTWLPTNEATHVRRHGISFETAALVFLDPTRRETEARAGRTGDLRYKTVGLVDGVAVAVIFAMKEDVAHIISARRANRREQR